MTAPYAERGLVKEQIRRLVLAFAVILIACTPQGRLEALRSQLHASQAERRTIPGPAVAGYKDVRGVIHAHSSLSWDSRGTPEEIIRAARQAGLSWLIMTDHNDPKIFTEGRGQGQGLYGRQGDLLVLRGAEISYRQSSLLAIQPSAYVDVSQETDDLRGVMERTIRAVQAKGGLAFLAHPGRFQDWSVTGYDGMEIYDLADAARSWHHLVRLPRYLADLIYSYDVYADELILDFVRQGFAWHPGRPLQRWDSLTAGRRVVGIAGNDAHQNLRLLGRQLDPYALIFRVVNTHLFVPRPRDRIDEPAVIAALRHGHAYVAFDLLADPEGFSFIVRDGRGVRGQGQSRSQNQKMMGDEIPFSHDLALEVTTPRRGLLRLIRNGAVVREEPIEAVRVHPVQAPGVYRVELWLEVDGRLWPWVFSNPIYVRGGPGS